VRTRLSFSVASLGERRSYEARAPPVIQATYSFLERRACAVDAARLAEYPRAYHRGLRKFPADTPRAPRTRSTSTHLQLSAPAPDNKGTYDPDRNELSCAMR
jgi:hypothetical protein